MVHLGVPVRVRRRRMKVPVSSLLSFAAVTVVVVLACCPQSIQANLKVPPGGVYTQQFFEQHSENAGVYPILVEVIQQGLRDNGILKDEDSNNNNSNKKNGQQPQYGPSSLSSDDYSYSVLDVGCGHGLLVEAWRAAGVTDSYCVEGSPAAQAMWPQRGKIQEKYYRIQDLTNTQAASQVIPITTLVTTFETAEHLPEEHAANFVSLLTKHRPDAVIFGAATIFQDQGTNPTHVNENNFDYWISKFEENKHKYIVDLATTAKIKHLLVTNPKFGPFMQAAWWYPKNMLVFVPASQQHSVDLRLLAHPKEANMLNEVYLGMTGDGEFGKLWRRDWSDFGRIFYAKQAEARLRFEGREEVSDDVFLDDDPDNGNDAIKDGEESTLRQQPKSRPLSQDEL